MRVMRFKPRLPPSGGAVGSLLREARTYYGTQLVCTALPMPSQADDDGQQVLLPFGGSGYAGGDSPVRMTYDDAPVLAYEYSNPEPDNAQLAAMAEAEEAMARQRHEEAQAHHQARLSPRSRPISPRPRPESSPRELAPTSPRPRLDLAPISLRPRCDLAGAQGGTGA